MIEVMVKVIKRCDKRTGDHSLKHDKFNNLIFQVGGCKKILNFEFNYMLNYF